MNVDVALCLPREAESVRVIRDIVTRALEALGVSEECVGDVVLGLCEACTNVIDHAVAEDAYEVRVHVEPEQCTITIRDEGAGFDADAIPDRPAEAGAEHGRGIAIMRAVMDRVDVAIVPDGGTVVQLVKVLTIDPTGPLARLT